MVSPFAERIRELRTDAGLSQGEVARHVNEVCQMGVTKTDVCHWEKDRTCPSPRVIVALADLLGEHPAVLCALAGKLEPETYTRLTTEPHFAVAVYDVVRGA